MREARGMLAQDVAAAIGMQVSYLSKLETLKLPLTVEKATAIAGVLGCDVALLYAPEGTTEPLT
jgi:transcriptional regulator with XRE-family HTH domain